MCSIPKAGGASGRYRDLCSQGRGAGAGFRPFQKAGIRFSDRHSMLHLMGYDHMTETEAADMERRQKEILEGIHIPRI